MGSLHSPLQMFFSSNCILLVSNDCNKYIKACNLFAPVTKLLIILLTLVAFMSSNFSLRFVSLCGS